MTRSVIGLDSDWNRRFGDTPVHFIVSLNTRALLHIKPASSRDVEHFETCEIRCVELKSTNGLQNSRRTLFYSNVQVPCIGIRQLEHPVVSPVMNSPPIVVEIRFSLLLLTVIRGK